MDFFRIVAEEDEKKGILKISADFTVGRSKDLMVRAKSFYAIHDKETGLWSTDEYDVQRLVDKELAEFADKQKTAGVTCVVKYLRSFKDNGWNQFRKFMANISDNSHDLDQKLIFANTEVKQTDYASKRLPYSLEPGDHSAWDKVLSRLYKEEERAKIEWTIGAILSGDSKKLQKFLVLYGPGGTGKSTVINVMEKLFEGYWVNFEASSLVGANNTFSTAAFKTNPLVAIDHDSDLSKVVDGTKLNSVVSHESMLINEKFKPAYSAKISALLVLGTNLPVKIADAKAGMIRRLIDAHPTGKLFAPNEYNSLVAKMDFEISAIAHHCLEVYRSMGKNFYNSYRPVEMMLQTDVFFNYIEACYDIFKSQDGTTLKQAYVLYKEFASDTGLAFVMPQYKFREELRNYFKEFHDRILIDGASVRSYYSGFTAQPFKAPPGHDAKVFPLVLDETSSLLDEMLADCPAQYANAKENPIKYWNDDERLINGVLKKPKPSQIVDTVLSDIDTSQLHFVQPPEQHIVIDFDIQDENGKKSLDRNLEAASLWPSTYAERSKSGEAIHLHYIYAGDVHELARVYDKHVEIKVFTGGASLRRRLSKCNNVPVATINGGLPLREKKMLGPTTIQSERGLRALVEKNMRKEIHAGTKSSIMFIDTILNEASMSGMMFDLSDLIPDLIAFANNSTNHADFCLKIVLKMKLKSEELITPIEQEPNSDLVFFDIESYPNLFLICWSYENSDDVVRMINPTAQEVEGLLKMRLVGFYNKGYDNHMLYAAYMGYTVEQLYELSKRLTSNDANTSAKAKFGAAYDLSHADVYDFSTVKMGLKKWQNELGIFHKEMDISWDEPVPADRMKDVEEYCVNDVISLKAVFKDRHQDYIARQILAELSGLTINDSTPKHAARIIFEGDRNPQSSFVYTDLSVMFPGYKYEMGKSTYKGIAVGEGGFVHGEPGMYDNVALEDVASMHPTSIKELNLFGKYTPNFVAILDARLAIKRGEYDAARKMFNGRLKPFLENTEDAKKLADALKIIINIVYGLTSAKFDNPFRDPRNKDNIVAKRGALFMIDLMLAVQAKGFTVAHVKTDSIKIPDYNPEILKFVEDFGKKYGYTFELEGVYDKFCLVNDAVYIARQDEPDLIGGVVHHWTAVGAQFQHPYVFKKLFSHEPIVFDDLCETKSVKDSALFLHFGTEKPMAFINGDTDMRFVGRTGRFIPVKEGYDGGILYRVREDKITTAAGTKGRLWIEADMAKLLPAEAIDMSYYEKLVEDARDTIDYYGSFHEFVN